MTRATRVALAAVTALAAVAGCGAGAGNGPEPSQAAGAPAPGRYASIDGLEMYYEVHGPETGRPLVLLHGSLSGIQPDFGELIPVLARDRRVIAVEQQAHGHTADVDRPLRVDQMAADTTALLRQLGVQQADVLGFSTGAAVALDMGLKEPALVHKLVLVSPMYDPAGMHPGLIEGLAGLQPEMLHGTPFHEYYLAAASRPDDFGSLVEKNKDLQLNYPKHSASTIQSLAAPVLLVVGDSDVVRIDHVTEFFRLLGGAVNGDIAGLPQSQLAVLPGTTHIGVMHRPELPSIVPAFLDAPRPG
ncbi:alpha/beta hydrolase family protein [Pseudonocardia hierapolitana]|uniref:Alpha/beta hydrolase family protein n=1 Tax=Pseudonocardia hierapolitana TaxID=1128676 RepID=A0A561ST69_9PSEU|nr:alpha/beta hydrolase [Pseudonocardia hierapolitana]TWF78051.1 alpha/beta hydrolase family protein [Pseudonocardia hierapolitana]